MNVGKAREDFPVTYTFCKI